MVVTLMKAMCLRRSKQTLIDGLPIITIKPKTIIIDKVSFSTKAENAFYAKIFDKARDKFQDLYDKDLVMRNQASIFAWICRLRLACLSPVLVRTGFTNFEKVERQMKRYDKKLINGMSKRLVNHLCSRNLETVGNVLPIYLNLF